MKVFGDCERAILIKHEKITHTAPFNRFNLLNRKKNIIILVFFICCGLGTSLSLESLEKSVVYIYFFPFITFRNTRRRAKTRIVKAVGVKIERGLVYCYYPSILMINNCSCCFFQTSPIEKHANDNNIPPSKQQHSSVSDGHGHSPSPAVDRGSSRTKSNASKSVSRGSRRH